MRRNESLIVIKVIFFIKYVMICEDNLVSDD